MDLIVHTRVESAINATIGVQSPDMFTGVSIQLVEIACDKDLTIGLHHNTANVVVGFCRKRIVHRSIRIEPHHITMNLTINLQKTSSNENPPVHLNCDRANPVVYVRIERGIHAAIGIETSDATPWLPG